MRIEGTEALPALTWRVRILMAERDIRTVTALQAKLRDVGIEVSTQFLSRVVSKPPARLNIALLQGLAQVLQCDVGDLLRRAAPAAVAPAPEPAEPVVRKSRRLRGGSHPGERNVRKLLGGIDPLDPERRPKASESS